MSISDRLQMVIKMNGMTNATFADTIGVQRSSISHVLSGRNKPSIDFIQKILEAFPKVDANWLVAGRKVGRSHPEVEDSKPSSSTREEEVIVHDEEREVYRSSPKSIVDKDSAAAQSPKQVLKVIILYNDGSFEEVSNGIN